MLNNEVIRKAKKNIRIRVKTERNQLSVGEIDSLSKQIWRNFRNYVLDGLRKNIMFYYSFGSEVFTHEIIRKLSEEYNIFLPRTKQEIEVCKYGNIFQENSYGIFEPITPSIKNPNLKMIIVPGIAFDKKGNRIGWGRGYYDKFLEKHPEAIRISPAYSLQIINKLPSLDHDQKIDIIITPKEIIETRAR